AHRAPGSGDRPAADRIVPASHASAAVDVLAAGGAVPARHLPATDAASLGGRPEGWGEPAIGRLAGGPRLPGGELEQRALAVAGQVDGARPEQGGSEVRPGSGPRPPLRQ